MLYRHSRLSSRQIQVVGARARAYDLVFVDCRQPGTSQKLFYLLGALGHLLRSRTCIRSWGHLRLMHKKPASIGPAFRNVRRISFSEKAVRWQAPKPVERYPGLAL